MKKPALFGCILTCFLMAVFLPRNTQGIELPNKAMAMLPNNDAVIYPNPVKDVFYFRSDAGNPVWSQSAELQFEIRNILGNEMPIAVEKVEQDIYRFDATGYPEGYYLLMVHCKSCQEDAPSKNAFKFLKQ